MPLPTVAILGRPNVGKSSLFNALVRSRVAIVDPTAGVTRDRVTALLRVGPRRCQLVDTGGIGIVDKAGLAREIEEQIQVALHEADVLLFLVDTAAGVMQPDREIADQLRRLDKPVLLIANKADAPSIDSQSAAFYALGLGDPMPLSASSGRGVGELRDRLAEILPEVAEEEADGDAIRLAVVGSPNAGKSTLVNRLLGEDRMIVSAVPGTTRDAVDLPFERNGQRFIAVDTAGLRKRAAVSGSPDFYGQARAERAIRRSQAVLFLIDATKPIGRVERSIGERILAAHRPFVMVLSKWDLVEDRSLEEFANYVHAELPFLKMAPITCLSAQEEFRLDETLDLLKELHAQAGARLGTGELNRIIRAAVERKGPPVKGGRTGKIFFATQIDVHPPTVVLFVNNAECMTPVYRRYIEGFLRQHGPYQEVPIRLWLRQKDSKKAAR